MWSSPLFSRQSIASIFLLLSLAAAQLVPGASYYNGNGAPGAAKYELVDDYSGTNFFNMFFFDDSYDPTYGHVQYVNKSVAVANGFVSILSNGTAKIIPDTTNNWPGANQLPPGESVLGRPSVRIVSDNTYTHGLFILDVVHMPWGCGTWPAYWLYGEGITWPGNGEIDIIEGVNTGNYNTLTLHTEAGCNIEGSGQTAAFQTGYCDSAYPDGGNGCGSNANDTLTPNNYGDGLNSIGGGVYATEWTSDYIQTWFFPRGGIPASITEGAPNVSTFGIPMVNAQGPDCTIDSYFKNMSIVLNIDFCGAWAGTVYQSDFPSCPQNASAPSSLDSCVDFVGMNPQAFVDAYWEINSIKVYQMPAGAVPTAAYSTSLSSVTPQASSLPYYEGQGGTSSTGQPPAYTGPLSSATNSVPSPGATPVICPSYNNTLWNDANQNEYTISCGSSYGGSSDGITNAIAGNIGSFEDCLELCDSTLKCLAVAYTGGNTPGTCYMFAGTGPLQYDGSTNAAVRVAGAVQSPYSSGTASTTAGAITSAGMVSTMSPTASMSLPSSMPPTSNMSPAASTPSSTAISCPASNGTTTTDSIGRVYEILCNTDLTTNSFNYTEGNADANDCVMQCGEQPQCVGATWYGYNCYLKSSFQGTTSSNGAILAVLLSALTPSSSSNTAISSATSMMASSSSLKSISMTTPSSSSTISGMAAMTSTSSTTSASPSASLLSCPAANGTQTTDPEGNVYELFCNSDTTVGSFNDTGNILDMETCVVQCGQQPTCVSVTYYGGACYFKNSFTGTVTLNNAEAAVKLSVLQPSSSSSKSSSMSSTRSPSSSASMAVTLSSSLSSTASPLPTCGASATNSSAPAAAPCQDTYGNTFNVTQGTQYTGTVSKRLSTPNINSCLLSCDSTPGCQAVNYANGTCSLLSQVTGTTTVAAAGVVAATRPAYVSTIYSTPAATSATTTSASVSSIPTPACNSTYMDPYNGATYSIKCGYDTSISSYDTVPVNSGGFGVCFGACDGSKGCSGFTYVPADQPLTPSQRGNCYLKKLAGTYVAGASDLVSCFKVSLLSNSSSPANSSVVAPSMSSAYPTGMGSTSASGTASPQCPHSAGSMYTDSNGIAYGIGCYTDYAGNDIGTPVAEASLAACLPYCDSMSGCVGVEFDVYSGLCYLKSSFTGLQTSNTSIIYANKGGAAPGATTGAAVTVTPSMTSTLSLPSGATITVIPISTVISTLKPGGTFVTGPSGSSYYIMNSATTSLTTGSSVSPSAPASLCYTCALTPTVISGATVPASGSAGGGTAGSSTAGGPTTAPSSTVSACPSSTASICASAGQQTTCSDPNLATYSVTCGIEYHGTVINPAPSKNKRQTQEPTFQACEVLCDGTPGCVALNYDGTSCTLLSHVTGTTSVPGAVGAILVSPASSGGSPTAVNIYPSTCKPTPGTGTTTVFTTQTITSCGMPMTCPASGYLIGGGGSQTGGVVVTTTNNNGQTITYTQFPTTGGGGGGGGGATTGSGSGGSGGGGTQTLTISGSTITATVATAQPTCPYNQGELYSDQRAMLYYVECNTLFTDETLDTQTQTSLAACIASCDMYNTMTFYLPSQCLGVSFYSTDTTDNCLLKAGANGTYEEGVDSARLMSPYGGPGGNGTCTGSGCTGGGGGGGGGITSIASTISGAVPALTTYVSGGTTSVYVSGGKTITSVYGGSTIVQTITAGYGGHGPVNGGGGGGSGGSGGTGVTYYSTYATVVGQTTIPEVSTYVSNGQTVLSTYGYSTVPGSTQYATATLVSGGSTVVSTALATAVSYIPSTVYGVSTAVSTYVSNGITYQSTYGVTTEISVDYLPASTKTVTTTTVSVSVSVSISNQVSTVSGPTITGPPQQVTITEGGGNDITITAPPSIIISYVYPNSSTSSFTCRTYATDYLNGGHGRMLRSHRKRSIFDVDQVMGEMEKLPMPMPGAAPRVWYL